MPTLTQLEYALAVDQHRHFGKAAQACHVSQPTLSMQLQKLEDELGTALFDRSKKPILPTSVGRAILEQARIAVGEFRKVTQVTAQGQKELTGEFRLAVIPTLAPYLIPLFIERFSESHPKLTLKIDELQTSQIVDALERDEIDAGLLVTPLRIDTITEEPLFYEPFSLYVRKDHALGKRATVSEDDLDGSEIWLMKEGHCMRTQMLKICSLSRRTSRVLKNVQFESGNLETLKRLVEMNDGYTLLPFLALGSPAVSAVNIPFTQPVPSREVSLVYRRTQLKLPHLNALATSVRESLPPELRAQKKQGVDVVGISRRDVGK